MNRWINKYLDRKTNIFFLDVVVSMIWDVMILFILAKQNMVFRTTGYIPLFQGIFMVISSTVTQYDNIIKSQGKQIRQRSNNKYRESMHLIFNIIQSLNKVNMIII